ncbi:MAG: TrmB family transcriptional regulator [Candidatus Bathyarchaeia archaeon]
MIDELMLENETIISKLERLGLTRLEAKVYLALLKRGVCKASDIMSELQIHQPQLYNVILSLQKKGFIIVQEGKPKLYSPASPLGILERKILELKKLRDHLKVLQERFEEKSSQITPHMWVIRGYHNVIYQARKLINEAQVEIQILVSQKIFKRLKESLVAAKRRGVHICLMLYPDRIDKSLMQAIKEIKTVKVASTGQFCLIVDSRLGIYGPDKAFTDDYVTDYGLLFNEPITACILAQYLYYVWTSLDYFFPITVDPKEFPKKFVNHRSAVSEIDKLKAAGYLVKARVRGRWVKSGKIFSGEGEVVETISKPLSTSFIIKLNNGKEVRVGGYDTKIDDVEAECIVLEIHKSSKNKTEKEKMKSFNKS